MSESHSLRVRGKRWKEIEKMAWKLSNEAGRIIKPTDVADAALALGIKDITLEKIEIAKKTRE